MSKGHIAGYEPMEVQVEAGKTYWWCRCGRSQNQPFRDNSHKRGGKLQPVEWTAKKSGTRYFCVCKQTNNPPFCDDTHKTLTS